MKLLLALILAGVPAWSFLPHRTHCLHKNDAWAHQRQCRTILHASVSDSTSERTYEHDGWNLSYKYKPACPGHESDTPLLLIHPVGVGISSWFWDNFTSEWNAGGEVFCPDLIGCGKSDYWDPDERGLFFPLSWVKACEALIQKIEKPCVVVVQGGLAPVGVMITARNASKVLGLVLCSPPVWDDMVQPIPPSEIERNYNFLSSTILSPLVFGVLETKAALTFFSNLFLFENESDPVWIQSCLNGCDVKALRRPIMAFNAGMLNHRSFEEEMRSIFQPSLLLSGRNDKRTEQRRMYGTEMKSCKMVTLDGCNVLPWESPRETSKEISRFCQDIARL